MSTRYSKEQIKKRQQDKCNKRQESYRAQENDIMISTLCALALSKKNRIKKDEYSRITRTPKNY